MTRRPRSRWAPFVLLLAFLAAGCSSLFPPLLEPTDEQGLLTVSVTRAAAADESDALYQVKLAMAGRKYELAEEIAADDGTPITFENIAVGRWRVTIHRIEQGRFITHSGVADVYVTTEPTYLKIDLVPNPGDLELHITLGDQCIDVGGDPRCLADAPRAARYLVRPTIQPDNKGDFTWEAGETSKIVVRRGMPPGSYEYQITFYDDKRGVGNVTFQSEWESFDILPGRVTHILWSPQTGSIDIGASVVGPPAPPSSLRLVRGPDGDSLAWDPSPDEVDRYVVYAKGTQQGWFCKIGQTSAHRRDWVIPDDHDVSCSDGDTPFGAVQYAIASVNAAGYESVRVYVDAPKTATARH